MPPNPTGASPTDEYITVDGLGFHCRDWHGSGQPVLLLHGLASTCYIWEEVAPLLAKDFRVVAMDQRGHGDSAKPDRGYDFTTIVLDAFGVIEAKDLDEPVIVGHSWGADVALELAAAHPARVKGICLVDGGTIEPSTRFASLDEARENMAPPVFTGMTMDAFRERIRPRVAEFGPAFERMILANFETLEDGAIRAKLSRENHIRIIEALWDHHPPELFPKVLCPALLMPARQKTPEGETRGLLRAETIAAAERLLPNGRTVWLEDSIHDVPVQRPELVAEVIKTHMDSGFFG